MNDFWGKHRPRFSICFILCGGLCVIFGSVLYVNIIQISVGISILGLGISLGCYSLYCGYIQRVEPEVIDMRVSEVFEIQRRSRDELSKNKEVKRPTVEIMPYNTITSLISPAKSDDYSPHLTDAKIRPKAKYDDVIV